MNQTAFSADSPVQAQWQDWLRCAEGQLQHYYEPEAGVFIAETPNVIERAIRADFQPLSFLIAQEQMTPQVQQILAGCPDVPVLTVPQCELDGITGFHLTRGVLCAMRRRPLPDPQTVIRTAGRIAVLENVMNPTNLGAIFRSAAALGMDAVLLSSGCTDPLYRRAVRVSMGTVFQLPWCYLPEAPTAAPGIAMLRAEGFLTAAMALRPHSAAVDDPRFSAAERLAVVLGTEGEGLANETITACDSTVMIPMAHGVDSLNVAAASAVAFWAMRRTED